jgi:hypothetical protein
MRRLDRKKGYRQFGKGYGMDIFIQGHIPPDEKKPIPGTERLYRNDGSPLPMDREQLRELGYSPLHKCVEEFLVQHEKQKFASQYADIIAQKTAEFEAKLRADLEADLRGGPKMVVTEADLDAVEDALDDIGVDEFTADVE